MGQKEARRQKRLAKQKQKRTVKRIQIARRNSSDPTDRLAQVDRWPILEALVPENLWDVGIGQCVIVRRVSGVDVGLGVYLIDTYCLGVKNCFWKILSEAEYKDVRARINTHGRLKAVSPEYLSKLVHCAADYAQALGFPPHADFRFARLLLDGIDPSLCQDEFAFGKDGKPLYVSGPNETLEFSRMASQRVKAVGGEYLVRIDEPSVLEEFPDGGDFEEDDDGADEE